MLRAVLVAVMSMGAVGGCKSATEPSAAPVPGVAAGKVLEVTGTVTVKHGDAARALAVGESVEGGDTVITGADGNVVIELAHNSARWELGPNKQQKVNESIAWKAAKSSGPAKDVEQDTAAAGRPAERNAAGTVAMADVEGAPMEAAAIEKDVQDKKVRRERAKAAAPARAPKAAGVVKADDMADVASDEMVRTRRGPVVKEAAPAPPPPPADPPGGGTSLGSVGTKGAGGGAAASLGAGASAPVVRTQLTARQSELRACLVEASHTADVTVEVKVTAGKPVVVVRSLDRGIAIDGALQACIKGVIAKIAFSADGSHTLTLKRP
jgi:hypothetical protein